VSGDLDEAARRVDVALERAGLLSEADKTVAFDLKTAVEGFHKEGLVRIVQALKADPRGKELLFELVDDPVVYALFVMHGIVRADPVTLAQQALDGVRPYLQSHGGDVELVGVDLPVARVRLSGTCTGCSQSATTLQEVVERALVSGVQGLHSVEVLPTDPEPAFIPLTSLEVRGSGGTARGYASGSANGSSNGWERGPDVESLADGKVTVWDGVALVRVGGRVAAYRDACAHQGLSLENALVDVDGRTLRCSWHGMTYDTWSGESMSMTGKRLHAYPARVESGAVWVRR
jgi:Fe-S cluster biogenesis protein NfuA/nitrite reductase/ring-hydroxylating ferredoxin subunit